MAIARFDDGLPSNPKLIAAGPVAAWLWLCGVMYCRRGLTDGFIPTAVVPTLVVGLRNSYRFAARLVEVGLWHEALGGYRVNDYLHWNPAKQTVQEYREGERRRAGANRSGRPGPPEYSGTVPTAYSGTVPPESERTPQSQARAKSLSAPESSAFSEGLEGGLGETAPPAGGNPHANPANLINGAEVRQHGQHAWCSWPARDGLCVPAFLHREFVGKLHREGADAELRAWYPTVVERFAEVAIGDDALRFWRHEFAAFAGVVTAPPRTSGPRPAARSTASDWTDECKRLHGGKCDSRYYHGLAMMDGGDA